jgi:hypothetical protein
VCTEDSDLSRIVAFESLTLDGVMQAPGRPDEDRRGGFEHGGWAVPYSDAAIGKAAQEGMGNTGGLLLGSGRRLFDGDGALSTLGLVDSKTTEKGVVIATYRPAEPTSPKPA